VAEVNAGLQQLFDADLSHRSAPFLFRLPDPPAFAANL
jgi:hypothetical protein